MDKGVAFLVSGFGFRVSGFGFRGQDLAFVVDALGFGIQGFRVQGSGCGVWGLPPMCSSVQSKRWIVFGSKCTCYRGTSLIRNTQPP